MAAASSSITEDDDYWRWWRERWDSPRFKPALRTCIGPLCRGQHSFQSAHAGERICPKCKAHLHDLYGEFDQALLG